MSKLLFFTPEKKTLLKEGIKKNVGFENNNFRN